MSLLPIIGKSSTRPSGVFRIISIVPELVTTSEFRPIPSFIPHVLLIAFLPVSVIVEPMNTHVGLNSYAIFMSHLVIAILSLLLSPQNGYTSTFWFCVITCTRFSRLSPVLNWLPLLNWLISYPW